MSACSSFGHVKLAVSGPRHQAKTAEWDGLAAGTAHTVVGGIVVQHRECPVDLRQSAGSVHYHGGVIGDTHSRSAHIEVVAGPSAIIRAVQLAGTDVRQVALDSPPLGKKPALELFQL